MSRSSLMSLSRGAWPLLLLLVLVNLQQHCVCPVQVSGMHYVSWLEPRGGVEGVATTDAPTPAPTTAPAPEANCSSWEFDPLHGKCNATVLQDVTNSDDLSQTLDLSQTNLRGSFPFLGSLRSHMDVNANGLLHFDSTDSPVCQSYAGPEMITYDGSTVQNLYNCWMGHQGHPINMQTTYFASVAVLLADLNPAMAQPYGFVGYSDYVYNASSSSSSSSSSSNDEDGVVVHYVNLPFYNTDIASNITVRARLRRTGKVTILWDRLHFDKAECGDNCDTQHLQSGIRAAPASASNVSSSLRLGSKQLQYAEDNWLSQVPAILPPHPSDIANSTLFHMCPMSDAWCMRPSAVQAYVAVAGSGAVYSAQKLSLRTLSFSCASDFDGYVCVFSTKNEDSPLYNSYSGEYRTAPTNGVVADVSSAVLEYYNSSYGVPAGRPTFTCDVPESIAGNEGSYGVSLYATFAAQRGVVVDGQYSSVSLIGPAPRSALQPSYQADTLELQVLPSGDSTLSSTYPLYLLSPAYTSTCVSLSLSHAHSH